MFQYGGGTHCVGTEGSHPLPSGKEKTAFTLPVLPRSRQCRLLVRGTIWVPVNKAAVCASVSWGQNLLRVHREPMYGQFHMGPPVPARPFRLGTLVPPLVKLEGSGLRWSHELLEGHRSRFPRLAFGVFLELLFWT